MNRKDVCLHKQTYVSMKECTFPCSPTIYGSGVETCWPYLSRYTSITVCEYNTWFFLFLQGIFLLSVRSFHFYKWHMDLFSSAGWYLSELIAHIVPSAVWWKLLALPSPPLSPHFHSSTSSCSLFKNSQASLPSIWTWWNWNEIFSVIFSPSSLYFPQMRKGLL